MDHYKFSDPFNFSSHRLLFFYLNILFAYFLPDTCTLTFLLSLSAAVFPLVLPNMFWIIKKACWSFLLPCPLGLWKYYLLSQACITNKSSKRTETAVDCWLQEMMSEQMTGQFLYHHHHFLNHSIIITEHFLDARLISLPSFWLGYSF